jgi:hypothetical protein
LSAHKHRRQHGIVPGEDAIGEMELMPVINRDDTFDNGHWVRRAWGSDDVARELFTFSDANLVGSNGLPIAFREIYAYIGGCASPLFVMPY